jgi:hypothetical protein
VPSFFRAQLHAAHSGRRRLAIDPGRASVTLGCENDEDEEQHQLVSPFRLGSASAHPHHPGGQQQGNSPLPPGGTALPFGPGVCGDPDFPGWIRAGRIAKAEVHATGECGPGSVRAGDRGTPEAAYDWSGSMNVLAIALSWVLLGGPSGPGRRTGPHRAPGQGTRALPRRLVVLAPRAGLTRGVSHVRRQILASGCPETRRRGSGDTWGWGFCQSRPSRTGSMNSSRENPLDNVNNSPSYIPTKGILMLMWLVPSTQGHGSRQFP